MDVLIEKNSDGFVITITRDNNIKTCIILSSFELNVLDKALSKVKKIIKAQNRKYKELNEY